MRISPSKVRDDAIDSDHRRCCPTSIGCNRNREAPSHV
jgi:hypothetical protein